MNIGMNIGLIGLLIVGVALVIGILVTLIKKKKKTTVKAIQQNIQPTRTCVSCSSELTGDDKFCQICGATVRE